MTNREAQIYQWITENPMISQEELAAKAGITRSSVAVHISNLMKKGYILGKGYITNDLAYITVIGAASVDISGRPDASWDAMDSNSGTVSISLGGAGRNIAHNLRLMGCNVKFISALGGDNYARRIIDNCNKYGIDINDCLMPGDEFNTSSYLYIAGADGMKQLALSDMKIYKNLTVEYFKKKVESINQSQAVVLDTGIPKETLEFLVKKITVPVFVRTVSGKKTGRIRNILPDIDTILLNTVEAGILTDMQVDAKDENALARAADKLLEMGVRRVCIATGGEGIYCAEEAMKKKLLFSFIDKKSDIGLKDAFMAGIINAHTKGYEPEDSVKIAMAAASIASENEYAVNEKLNWQEMMKRAEINK